MQTLTPEVKQVMTEMGKDPNVDKQEIDAAAERANDPQCAYTEEMRRAMN